MYKLIVMLRIGCCLLFTIAIGHVFGQTTLTGRVVDKTTHDPLEDAVVSRKGSPAASLTDKEGRFSLRVSGPADSLIVSHIGYQTQCVCPADCCRNGRCTKDGDCCGGGDILMARRSVDLRAVTITPGVNTGFHTLSNIDLRFRPVNSSQDLMRLVPGLFLGQHQGGGVAEHIFFRGFDADHGTDVNVSVDGMPLNLVSHIHGQGFSDLHFLIPELVDKYDYGKGPYYPGYGDFTTAGYVAFHTVDVLDRSELKIEGGAFHTGRVMTMINLLGNQAPRDQHAYIAAEGAYTDGAFDQPQHFRRLNLFGKYHISVSPKTKLSVTLSTFESRWRSSGEIPERAVSEGLISRWGYIDSAQGGQTARTTAIVRAKTTLGENLVLENQAYYTHYSFTLHYDPTFFAVDSVNGDQLRQQEWRDLVGYNGRLTHHAYFHDGSDLHSTIGAGMQLNFIPQSALNHTVHQDQVLADIQSGSIREGVFNGFIDEDYHRGNWELDAGARFDYLHVAYRDALAASQAGRGNMTASPKINLSYTVNSTLQFYLKAGKGFHSNDAKAVIANRGLDVLPAAYGADLGMNWKPIPRLFLNIALWRLDLHQEFTYDGDDGTFEPGDPTRRQGIDLSARYQLTSWLFANADVNYCKARDMTAEKGNNYLPLAVPLSSTGGLDVKLPKGFSTGLSYRYMKDRPANSDNSLVAKGYFITDLTANYTCHRYEVGMEIQNLFNSKWAEEQYEIVSRMRGEPAPVDDVGFTPGTPFFLKLKMTVFF